MKLSKREAILLAILLVLAICFLEYQLFIIPGLAKYDSLKAKDQSVQAKVDETNRLIGSLPSLITKKEKTLSDVSSSGEAFYDQLNADALLWNTNDLLTKSGLTVTSYTISPVAVGSISTASSNVSEMTYQMRNLANEYAKIESGASPATSSGSSTASTNSSTNTNKTAPVTVNKSNEVEIFTVSAYFSGSYDQVKKFVSSLESLRKSIVIKSLSISSKDFLGNVDAEIVVNYYGVKKLISKSDSSNVWQLPEYSARSGNPFIQSAPVLLPSPAPMPVKP